MALAFDNGDPAVDRGAAAPRDGDPGGHLGRHRLDDLADPQSYPPVMEQIVLRASAGRLTERNIRVGQPYDQSFPETATAAAGDGRHAQGAVASPPKLQPAGGVSQFHFEQTDLSGAYKVKIGPPLGLESSFAANPDPAESDLDQAGRRPCWASSCPAGSSSTSILPTGRS